MEASDRELLDGIRENKRDGFEALVRKYEDRVVALAYSFVRDADEARDVAQTAFVLVYDRIETFRGTSALFTWIYRVTFNVATDHLRRRRSRVRNWLPLTETSVPAVDEAGRVLDALDREHVGEIVRAAVSRLPGKDRDVVTLKDLNGLSVEQVSQVLGCNAGTVKSRLSRAREKLRAELAPVVTKEVLRGL